MMGAPEIPLVLQPLVMPIRYTSAGKVPSEERNCSGHLNLYCLTGTLNHFFTQPLEERIHP